MKKNKNNHCNIIEPLGLSFFEALFNPTIEMAAELMNVSNNVIEDWLQQEHIPVVGGIHLTDNAIDFLAEKHLERIHQYFDNCINNWSNLDDNERRLFQKFRVRYSKFYFIWSPGWKQIDCKQIINDFKNELRRKASETYLSTYEIFSFGADNIGSNSANIEAICHFDYSCIFEGPSILVAISHSLYYGSRIKTQIPTRPEYRNIVLEILQENRFHIFSGESDSNVLLDAILHYYVKQPQLAIANVFGYSRHKNNKINENIFKNQTYCFC